MRFDYEKWSRCDNYDSQGRLRYDRKMPKDHPFSGMARANGNVLEHRVAMAYKLGRPLLRSETVHHVDGNSINNDPSNLQVRHGAHGVGVRMCCQECGSDNVQPEILEEAA